MLTITREDLEEIRDALRFYAGRENHRDKFAYGDNDVHDDCGYEARLALAKIDAILKEKE